MGSPTTLNLLTDAEANRVHEASLRILSEVGLRVDDEEARSYLGAAGAQVNLQSNVVRFPAHVVEQALRSTPSTLRLYDRNQASYTEVAAGRVCFGSSGYAVYVYDLDSGQRRQVLRSDLADMTRLVDSLEHCAIVGILGTPSDVPELTVDRHQMAITLQNTQKHILAEATGHDGAADVIAMAVAVTGSLEKLRERPIFTFDVTVSSPLMLSESPAQVLIEGAKAGIPMGISSGPMAGATSPVTLGGTLAMANAETLAGLVLTQVVSPGAPVIYTSWSRSLDMRVANVTMGSPEFALLRVCTAQMARYYNLPSRGGALMTDSKIPDAQAGYEKMQTCLLSALAGLSIVAGIGQTDFIKTMSFEQAIIDNEIAHMTQRILAGIAVSDATLAVDVIKNVGPGGNFLSTDHTLEHFRAELQDPLLSDRFLYEQWQAKGAPIADARAKAVARHVLATHSVPQLPDSVIKGIGAILQRADARVA